MWKHIYKCTMYIISVVLQTDSGRIKYSIIRSSYTPVNNFAQFVISESAGGIYLSQPLTREGVPNSFEVCTVLYFKVFMIDIHDWQNLLEFDMAKSVRIWHNFLKSAYMSTFPDSAGGSRIFTQIFKTSRIHTIYCREASVSRDLKCNKSYRFSSQFRLINTPPFAIR